MYLRATVDTRRVRTLNVMKVSCVCYTVTESVQVLSNTYTRTDTVLTHTDNRTPYVNVNEDLVSYLLNIHTHEIEH